MPSKAKVIVLVDANNFFVSCERAFNPALNGRPVVVLSNNDGNVIARSEEAKAAGVEMGEVFYKNRARYDEQGIVYLSSNYTIYTAKSQQIIGILARFAPSLEYYSVDEAWLDLTETDYREEGFDSILAYCRHIRHVVLEEAGIPCSFGIGRNKTEAKLAVRVAKKQPKVSGVFNLIDHPLAENILARTKVRDIWGINRGMGSRLMKLGIHTARDLRDADVSWVRKHTNVNVAKLIYELRGEYCQILAEKPPMPKMITTSLSFSYEVSRMEDVLEATASYIARAAARMRRQNLAAKQLLVILNTNKYSKTAPFSVDYGEASLPRHSLYTPDFIEAAGEIVRRCFDPEKRYHKVTVILHDLIPADEVQVSLFDCRDWAEMAIKMAFVDTLNEWYGEGSFRFMGEGNRQPWAVKRAHLSAATIETMGLKPINPDLLPICRIGTDPSLVEELQDARLKTFLQVSSG